MSIHELWYSSHFHASSVGNNWFHGINVRSLRPSLAWVLALVQLQAAWERSCCVRWNLRNGLSGGKHPNAMVHHHFLKDNCSFG